MAKKNGSEKQDGVKVVSRVTAPNYQWLDFRLEGTAPYMQSRFPFKAMQQMREKMEQGTRAKKGAPRSVRDFTDDYEQAKHVSDEGWCGVPAGAFRAACISACRLVGFKMTLAKLAFFVEADGFDRLDGTPLVRLHGEPEQNVSPVRLANKSTDLRSRPMWRKWWLNLRVRFDADIFEVSDIANLLSRVGGQVGIGEGRPDSKSSCGIGFGTFKLTNAADA